MHIGISFSMQDGCKSGRCADMLFGLWPFWCVISEPQLELKPVFSDNLISSVNTHPTDARFHGINEAASCADACERRAPFKLLSFIASPRLSSLPQKSH